MTMYLKFLITQWKLGKLNKENFFHCIKTMSECGLSEEAEN